MKRVKGIDSIRFISALIVLLGHFGFQLPNSFGPNAYGFHKIIRGILQCLFNGPAAVIVFFIISGFCIHFPYRNANSITLKSFYVRRLIRIFIPAFIAIVIYFFVKIDLSPPNYAVFWSIICESIYYLLYPVIFFVIKYVNLKKLVFISYIFAYILIIIHIEDLRQNSDYMSLNLLTWIIGLPCWLLGCWLAENFSVFPKISLNLLWVVRIFVLLTSVALKLANFHIKEVADPIFASYCLTLNLFAVVACIWIAFEIAFSEDHNPSNFFEWCGRWSYSLYLIHPTVPYILSLCGIEMVSLSGNKHYLLLYCIALLLSLAFYILVERPSHRFSAILSNNFKKI